MKEKFNLRDIWRIRSPKIKHDYFLVSNLLQESGDKTDVLADFSTDHSPLLFSLDLRKYENRGKGPWKFNISLSMNSEFVAKMKFHVNSTLETLEKKEITDFQIRWKFLKYKIRKFTIEFSNLQAH